LVDTCAELAALGPDLSAEACWRSDLLQVATWRAARFGTGGDIVHPVKAELAPFRTVLEDTIELVRPALEDSGDIDDVTSLAGRLLNRAGGATRQRRVYARTGSLTAVVDDLADRTEASWMTS